MGNFCFLCKKIEISRLELIDKECSICLDEFDSKENVEKLLCNHLFHKDCLNEWKCKFKTTATCPICRKKII